MAQRKITADAAFDALREASQRRNVKLRDVAQEVVDKATSGGSPSAAMSRLRCGGCVSANRPGCGRRETA
jgi:hypothetical protein